VQKIARLVGQFNYPKLALHGLSAPTSSERHADLHKDPPFTPSRPKSELKTANEKIIDRQTAEVGLTPAPQIGF
jgi:hypothetical protein